MKPRLAGQQQSLLEHRLGEERWRRSQRAAWRGSGVEDDPLLAAAAAELARVNLRSLRWLGPLTVLLVATTTVVLVRAEVALWPVLSAVGAGIAVFAVLCTVRYRRAIPRLDGAADHAALEALVADHTTGRRSSTRTTSWWPPDTAEGAPGAGGSPDQREGAP